MFMIFKTFAPHKKNSGYAIRLPRRGDGLEVEPMSRNPGGRDSIPRLGSRRSSLISIEHAELLHSTPSLVLCCVWQVTMALHVHCGLG